MSGEKRTTANELNDKIERYTDRAQQHRNAYDNKRNIRQSFKLDDKGDNKPQKWHPSDFGRCLFFSPQSLKVKERPHCYKRNKRQS